MSPEFSWAEVAEKVGYASPVSARQVTQTHRDVWGPLFEEVRAEHLGEVEASVTATALVLSKTAQDERVRQAACHSLLQHVSRCRGQLVRLRAEPPEEANPPSALILQATLKARGLLVEPVPVVEG